MVFDSCWIDETDDIAICSLTVGVILLTAGLSRGGNKEKNLLSLGPH